MRTNVSLTCGRSFAARARRGRPHRGFSLVEILVVIAILAILLAMVFKGGGAMMNKAKVSDTEALLSALDQAVIAYRSEVSSARIPNADALFLGSPPDNPHVFQASGTTITGCAIAMARGGALTRSGSPLPDRWFEDARGGSGPLNPPSAETMKHGDMRALVLAMRLRSPKASAILDRIDARFLASGREEGLFYDPGDGSEPLALDYYVDAWGTPLEYYATCPCPGASALTPREAASAAFVKANNNEALLVSYGPDGPDQFAQDFFDSEGDTSMVGDYWDDTAGTGAPDRLVNHVLNQDNIYSSDTFKERMMK